MDLQPIFDLIGQHAWIPLAVLIIGALVRVMKDDRAVAWFPVTIPPQYRGWIAVALGLGAGVLDSIGRGEALLPALLQGLLAAVTAISGHELVVEGIRNGRDIGVSKQTFAARASQRGAVQLDAGAIILGGVLLAWAAIMVVASMSSGCAEAKQDAKTVENVLHIVCPDFDACIDRLLASPAVDPETKTKLAAAKRGPRLDGGK